MVTDAVQSVTKSIEDRGSVFILQKVYVKTRLKFGESLLSFSSEFESGEDKNENVFTL
jgi:hypothetical protein